jgi:sec-independent protein translocase protein TatC
MTTSAIPVELDDGRMSLIEHLTELRNRIIKIVLAVILGSLIAFVLYEWIYDFLIHPYVDLAKSRDLGIGQDGRLLITDPLEGFGIRMKTSLYAGIALAMPVILWQVWRFVTPGLYPHEKRYAVPFLLSALALFVLGAGLAYYTLPRALEFLVDIGGSDNFIVAYSPAKYFKLVTYMMLAFGVGFEFPILLIFLQMAGIVTPRLLASFRRYAIVGICVVVAVITPSGDPISMLMLSVPMCIFYEVAIIVGRIMERRRSAARA